MLVSFVLTTRPSSNSPLSFLLLNITCSSPSNNFEIHDKIHRISLIAYKMAKHLVDRNSIFESYKFIVFCQEKSVKVVSNE